MKQASVARPRPPTPHAPDAAKTPPVGPAATALGEQDIHLFREGTHARLYAKLGCQLDDSGAHFAVWAPNARAVSVIGDFNGWDAEVNRARPRGDGSGLWEARIAGVKPGHCYKFAIFTPAGESTLR